MRVEGEEGGGDDVWRGFSLSVCVYRMCGMEAELLTVLGRIPAPDDRDMATQLAAIERSVGGSPIEFCL